ncbi:MAG: hypothetical protein Fur005_10780 [Roseiflexaceae bacterium]
MQPIRVAIADDHVLVRTGFVAVLRELPSIEVVGQAANGELAIALAEQAQPDIFLMDLRMPVMDGIEATRRLQAWPQIRVIILTGSSDEEHFHQAIEAGAAGYLLKDAGMLELEQVLRMAMQGVFYLGPTMAAYASHPALQQRQFAVAPARSMERSPAIE